MEGILDVISCVHNISHKLKARSLLLKSAAAEWNNIFWEYDKDLTILLRVLYSNVLQICPASWLRRHYLTINMTSLNAFLPLTRHSQAEKISTQKLYWGAEEQTCFCSYVTSPVPIFTISSSSLVSNIHCNWLCLVSLFI